MSDRSFEIIKGIPENVIAIIPPFEEHERASLLDSNVITETMLEEGTVNGEAASLVYWGRVVLGNCATMDRGTEKIREDIKNHLESLPQGTPA